MDNRDREKFMHLLAVLAATFGKPMSEAMLEGYWLGLRDLPLADVDRAIETAIRERDFIPSPAELRKATTEPLGVLAAEAWEEAVRLVRRGRGKASDPVTEKVLRLLGGLDRLGLKESEEFHTWTRREFLRLWEEVFRQREGKLAIGAGDDDLGLLDVGDIGRMPE